MIIESLSYDNLIVGGADLVTDQITIGKLQTVLSGDVLVKDIATGTYVRPQTAIADTESVMIAAESISTDANTIVSSIGYRSGEFNEFSMRFGGTSTADDNRDVLADKSIYIKKG